MRKLKIIVAEMNTNLVKPLESLRNLRKEVGSVLQYFKDNQISPPQGFRESAAALLQPVGQLDTLLQKYNPTQPKQVFTNPPKISSYSAISQESVRIVEQVKTWVPKIDRLWNEVTQGSLKIDPGNRQNIKNEILAFKAEHPKFLSLVRQALGS